MKKNILKIAFTLVLAFVITGVFAQATDVPGDGADFATNWAATGTVHMVEGGTIPLFAMPDPYFHPDYDNTGTPDYTLNAAGFTWVWTEATATLSITQSAPEDNYVTVGAGVGDAGTYTVNVVETAPAGWGGCDDGTGTNASVVVHAVPAVTLGGTASYNLCEGDAGLPAAVTATISDGYQNYRLVWQLEIKTLNADGTDKDFYDTDKTTTPVALAESYTTAAPEAVAAAGAHAITSIGGGFTVIDNSATVYTYTLTSINDQASRNCDFITLGGNESVAANFTYYANAETVTVRVNPTPTTGPIYHINNGWAN